MAENKPKANKNSKNQTDQDEIKLPEKSVIDDPTTEQAVNEIIDEESDRLLSDLNANDEADIKPPTRPKGRIRAWLSTKKAKKVILAASATAILLLLLLPWSRYFLLNSAGVRVSSSITVLDESTNQPLKNVVVSLGSFSARTDESGKAEIEKLRLGTTELKIEKIAFAPIHKKVTLGWGSNPLGSIKLAPTGAQYEIVATDFLSGKGVKGVEASLGEASALSDDKGKIILTIPSAEAEILKVNISAKDYRQEIVQINANSNKATDIKLVPSRKHAFISKRSGKYDIYTIYIDGKEEQRILKGSGSETEDLSLVSHPSAFVAAYVSTRGNQHNSDDYLLSNLVIVNLEDGKTTLVTTSERILIIGWAGDRLIYAQIAGGSSGAFDRSKLMSFNYQDGSTKQLAVSNYFNDLVLADGRVYFAPSSTSTGGLAAKFYKINPDGSNLQTILDREVWSFSRTAFNHLALSVNQDWYDYELGQTAANKLNSQPPDTTNRKYLDSGNGRLSAWVDQRDGKGALLVFDKNKRQDSTITAQKGLSLPLVWLSPNTLVFRLDNNTGVADYAVSLDGGEPAKIRDVTKTDDNDNWYYY